MFCVLTAYSTLATNGTSLECLNLIVQSINSAAAHAHQQQQHQNQQSSGQYHPHHQPSMAALSVTAAAQMTSGCSSTSAAKTETKVL